MLDLSRGADGQTMVLPGRPIPVRIDLATTALVVVDMSNDSVHPRGWAGATGADRSAALGLLRPIRAAVAAVRARGGLVAWANWGVPADLHGIPHSLRRAYAATPLGLGDVVPGSGHRAMVAGEWGSQVYAELDPHPGDVVIAKRRLSAFHGGELDDTLRAAGRTTLLFAGVNADQCVAASLISAAELGYDCVLLTDCCATSSPGFCWEATLHTVTVCYGSVASFGGLATLRIPRGTGGRSAGRCRPRRRPRVRRGTQLTAENSFEWSLGRRERRSPDLCRRARSRPGRTRRSFASGHLCS
jgi:nicotinamidase-related amidase